MFSISHMWHVTWFYMECSISVYGEFVVSVCCCGCCVLKGKTCVLCYPWHDIKVIVWRMTFEQVKWFPPKQMYVGIVSRIIWSWIRSPFLKVTDSNNFHYFHVKFPHFVLSSLDLIQFTMLAFSADCQHHESNSFCPAFTIREKRAGL